MVALRRSPRKPRTTPAAGRRVSRARLSKLREHRNFAILIVPLLPALVWTGDRLQASLASDGPDFPLRLAALGLLVATLLYFTSWFFGSAAELTAIEQVGEDLLTYVPQSELPAVLVTGLALALLGLATVDVLAFALVLLVIKLIELAASWPLGRVVREGLGAAADARGPGLDQALAAIRRYYLDTPWAVLTAITLGLTAAAATMAAYGTVTPDPALSVSVRTLSAIVLIIAIAIQEGRTWGWRRQYVAALEAAATAERPKARQPRARRTGSGADPG